uniref:L1 transposable element RRM domain-containing protein n=1 Tax=Myripristis murdjan TaxID=586833 RepID=A0A667ZPJ3_9TELE
MSLAQTNAPGEITLQAVWDAIQGIKQHIDEKTEPLQTSLAALQTSLNNVNGHIEELENRVSTNEDDIENHKTRLEQLEESHAHLVDKIEDLENRSRRSNLRFIHVPESAEGRDIIAFMSRLIPELLGHENFPEPPAIERAHRSPTFRRVDDTAKPRPILVKLLNFQDKVKILRLARKKNQLLYNGSRIHIYPDFSPELAKKRRGFDKVKRRLHELNYKFSLRYPCTLSVLVDGKVQLFRSPEDAELAFMPPSPASEVSMGSPEGT